MGDNIQIHLSRPGGQQEGPYTLEQINRDLAAKKYQDTDYWAWHEGLTDWVPLYTLPGILTNGASAAPAAATDAVEEVASPAEPQVMAPDGPPAVVSPVPTAAAPAPAAATAPPSPQGLASADEADAVSPAPDATAPELEEGPAAEIVSKL